MNELVNLPVYTVKQYTQEDIAVWDKFIDDSINGTFLFRRSFMDYHKDRFSDKSYMVWNKENLIAVFVAAVPKNASNHHVLIAHPGLTYGGLVYKCDIKYEQLENVFNSLVAKIKSDGFEKIVIKPVARVFCKEYSEAQEFYFYKNNFEIICRDVNSVINLNNPLRLTKARRKNIRKASATGVVIQKNDSLIEFWDIMSDSLMKTHSVKPVHTVDEMYGLIKNNPDNIRLYTASINDKIVGGTLLFIDAARGFVHSQYTHANEEGRSARVIDALVVYAAEVAKQEGILKFSFGISTVNSEVNYGLLSQKEDFGSVIELTDVFEKHL
ncbi:hypothetical protein HNQ93_002031 [Hymenobacter luteus]|uniref:BioF2-like acetyltransferase domain-containing protein n=2 Tax=Hymenobacter TaxID=89966 RepID=A0A7W9T0H3_9BACT|nr:MULTISPECIES: GNAT family N-acetyltransferase [Hymenobacter]MBB4600608.1 hypothetical protein [Hymenobacter latericoloratus]MBB6059185.1 hypothetical protein [Hymenobacter luteus]